jgi:S-adenosylmethionine:tRNA ribosyltransferase-isomerase
MDLSLFDFNLPAELIANRPIEPRNDSRLLIGSSPIVHENFNNILNFIEKDDLIITNNSKVIPSYFLINHKSNKIKITFYKKIKNDEWLAFIKPGKKIKIGESINLSEDYSFEIKDKTENGDYLIKIDTNESLIFDKFGKMPLPPYILKSRESDEKDFEDYQTIYASQKGSIAAPTAGLHFNKKIYDTLKENNQLAEVTLHVGLGTFKPIRGDINDHKMHSEAGIITNEVVELIKEKKSKKGRIISVGTTTLRLLEAAALSGDLLPFKGTTNIFIKPGFKFKVVDMLLTNFHLPKSSLMLLVSSFSGISEIKKIYREAIDKNYRFYSYGDVSLLYKHE